MQLLQIEQISQFDTEFRGSKSTVNFHNRRKISQGDSQILQPDIKQNICCKVKYHDIQSIGKPKMNILLPSNWLFIILFSYCSYIGSCTDSSSDTEADVSEIIVYNQSLAALKRSEVLAQQQHDVSIRSKLNPEANAFGDALFGVNYRGMPIAMANSLWWYCFKIIQHISGSRPRVNTIKGRKPLRNINLDAIHLEVFSKIRIKKINDSLDFWVECRQPDNGIITENKPTKTWRYNPDKMRSVFHQLDNQLELIRTYLLNNGWRLIQETLSQEFELYEFHHGTKNLTFNSLNRVYS